MTEYRWIRVTTRDKLPPREGRSIQLGGRELALFDLGDRILAVANQCPHQGGPLADGIVAGEAVVCPLHAWKIDLATGSVLRPSAAGGSSVPSYPVRLEGTVIVVGLPMNDTVAADASANGACAATSCAAMPRVAAAARTSSGVS